MRRESLHAGGTSVSPEATGGGRGLWIAGGVVLLAGAIVAIVALTGGKRRPAVADDGLEPEAVTATVNAPLDEPLTAPVAPVRLDPLGAADRLERMLATERFFAKSTINGSIVELRSEFCAQARLRAIVVVASDDLRAQGLSLLHCVELHGAEVFTQPL